MIRIDVPPRSPLPALRLEVRDLEVVLALATLGTTGRAARTLHVTQSAVSRALTQAEERLGVQLFERGPRGLTPTAAGNRLVTGARTLLSQFRELERSVVEPDVPATHLRLVCECYTAYRWLPSAMSLLGAQLPGLALEIRAEHTAAPVRALLEGQIDVALLTTSSVRDVEKARGRFAERPLFSDEIIFLVSRDHPLADCKVLTREALAKARLITSAPASGERRWFMKSVFGKRPPKLDFLLLPLTEAVVDAARAGMGIAVLSEWVASPYLESGDLRLKRLASGPLRRAWRVAFRRELGDSVTSLLAALTHAAPHSNPA